MKLKHNDNWEAIYREMARTRQLLADEKKAAEIQALAAAKSGTAPPSPKLPEKQNRKRPVSYHDDSKERWESEHNGPQLEWPNA